MIPDGRHLVSRARDEAASWRTSYKSPIPSSSLAFRVGSYVQAYTLYSSVRPFGVTTILGGWDSEDAKPVDGQVGSGPKEGGGSKSMSVKLGGPGLYMIEPSGLYWVSKVFLDEILSTFLYNVLRHPKGYYGAATGKGRQAAKAELEKLDLSSGNLSLEQGVKEAARIIYIAHEDSKDKDFELEMSWISSLDGPTKGRHQEVPKNILEEAESFAKRAMEGDDDEDTATGGRETMEE